MRDGKRSIFHRQCEYATDGALMPCPTGDEAATTGWRAVSCLELPVPEVCSARLCH